MRTREDIERDQKQNHSTDSDILLEVALDIREVLLEMQGTQHDMHHRLHDRFNDIGNELAAMREAVQRQGRA